MPRLKIVDVSVRDVRFPTSDTLSGSDAMNPSPDYSASYVELMTDHSGLSGFGFTFTIGRGSDIVTRMVAELAEQFVGRSVGDVADMPAFMAASLEELTQDSFLRWLGPEKGVAHLAAAAVLNALWDLWARAAGVPLWQLLAELEPQQLVSCLSMRHLGDVLTPDEAVAMLEERRSGHQRRIEELRAGGYPAYLTSVGWLGYSDEQVRDLVNEAIGQGWNAFKLKVGGNLEDDRRRIAMVRELIGGERKLMVDANQVWEVPEAIEWIKELTDWDLSWVEEPTSPDDIAGHRAIAEAVAPVPIASGEQAHNRIMFKQFLASGAIGVCQIDSCRMASVNENIPVLLLAAKYDVPVCPHAGGVGLCELVQHLSMFDYIAVSASLDRRWTEYVDHLHEMFVSPVRIRGGAYQLPLAAGFSSEMTEEALAAYSYPDGTVWKARAESSNSHGS